MYCASPSPYAGTLFNTIAAFGYGLCRRLKLRRLPLPDFSPPVEVTCINKPPPRASDVGPKYHFASTVFHRPVYLRSGCPYPNPRRCS